MSPNRRDFLGYMASTGLLPLLPASLYALTNHEPSVRGAGFAVIDRSTPEARAFAAATPRHARGIVAAADLRGARLPGALLEAPQIYGLTGMRDFHKIARAAAGQAFTIDFIAVHDTRDGALQHTLHGDRWLVEQLAGSIGMPSRMWPRLLARALALAPEPGAATRTRVVATRIAARHASGRLASWRLRPV